ncbi:tripartite tricarboxylate transporter TctB family protein [Anaerotruncus rubiinfantis]|uniref:tripartite tricarboxylate transporter TctB family protein n=1 Tax=Anaerotruncus rubiinfantis TaxID=1720200 RepID=UPI0034A1F5B1
MMLGKVHKITAGFLVLFGIVFFYLARPLAFGSFSKPGTGFMPKLFSVLLTVFAVVNLLLELRRPDNEAEMLSQVDWKKALLYVFACAFYVLLLMTVGYLIATLVSLYLMIRFTGIKGRLVPILTTVGVAFFFYFVFYKLLAVPLPQVNPWLADLLPFI